MQSDDKVLRVLQLNCGSKNFGGVSSFLYNIYTHIDRDQVQFDFLSPEITTYGIHRDEITDMGGQIFEFNITGNFIKKKVCLYFRLKSFLKEHPYKIVHINSGNFFFNLVTVAASKKAGVPVRIVHSHNAGNMDRRFKRIAFKLMKPIMESKATHLFACSQAAADYMFSKKSVSSGNVRIIYNGIDTKKFTRNDETGKRLRDEWGLDGKFVVGHVGRFMIQKNHEFLIDIFEQTFKLEPNSVLLLFGEGERMPAIKKLVSEKGLSSAVKFMGVMDNIEDAYQTLDVFILPSFHEGLPVTGIEVQAEGIPCLLSDTITPEVKITDDVTFLSLNEDSHIWAETAISLRKDKLYSRTKEVETAGYDISLVAKNMQDFYLRQLSQA